MKKFKYTIILVFVLCAMAACKKDFLYVKPNTKIITPTSLEDLQSLLENNTIINYSDPSLVTLSADEYNYPDYAAFQAAPIDYFRNAYIWKKDIYNGYVSDDWETSYTKVFYANVVLEQLEKMTSKESITRWKGRHYLFWKCIQLHKSNRI